MTSRARLRPTVPALAALLLGAAILPAAAQSTASPPTVAPPAAPTPAAPTPAAPPPAAPAPAAPMAATPPAATAEQAQQIEAGLRAWLADKIGAVADVSALPLRVVAGVDTYRLELPLGMSVANGAVTLGDGTLSARIRPLDGGRWAIEDVQGPSPWSITFDPKLREASKTGLSGMTMRIGEQTMTGVLDPTLATPSRLDAQFRRYSTVAEGARGKDSTRIGSGTGHLVLQPNRDGLITLTSQSDANNYSANSTLPDGKALHVAIARMHSVMTVTDLSFADLGTLIRTSATLGAAVRAQKAEGKLHGPDGAPGMPEADKASLKTLVRALADTMGGMTGQGSYDGFRFAVGNVTGRLRRVSIGFDMAAPAGRADLVWRIGVDGIDSSAIPKGPFRALVPRHVSLTPHVGGVSKQALVDLVLGAIDDPAATDDFMTVMGDLLAKGPFRAGLDHIAFDVGPAQVSGSGMVTVAAMDDITGWADLRATGLDELLQLSNGNPELKQAAAGLIFLKGIGKQEGDVTVWRIRYADHKVVVNGTDMSGMIPGRHRRRQ